MMPFLMSYWIGAGGPKHCKRT